MTAPDQVITTAGAPALDVAAIRADFPILDRTVRGGRPLVYLDSGNTSQKPRQVIDAMAEFYEQHNANIHRATHELGEEATEAYEGARIKVARFIQAADESEVVFTKNVSEAINLVAYSIGNATAGSASSPLRLQPGDEIVITEMEHHSNIVPWQLLCERTGARLRWFSVTPDGRLDLAQADELIGPRTKLVSVAHQSNVLGTINPVAEIAARAHAVGALCWWTPPSPRRTDWWTSRSWTPTWSVSPVTRCAGRPVSACSGAVARCWSSCRHSSAAAR